MRRSSRGQTIVILALIIPALLGAIALGTDVSVFYFNWVQLQKAADAAALGGANYLPDNPSAAQTAASQLAQSNGIKASEIVSNTVTADGLSISIKLQRTVPYYFAKVLGLTSGVVTTAATGSPQFPPSTLNATMPGQVPVNNDGCNGGTCNALGGCGLVPIGLDYHTVYTDGQQVNLQQGQLGPGNWDLLALCGPGGATLRTQIDNGFNAMLTVGDWITTNTGKKVGPVDQGFQDRIDRASSVDPNGTWSSHALTNPRVLILPVIDWEHPNGNSKVQVKSFASVWLDSYSSGQVTVHYISQVIANSYGDPSAPYFGSRGSPILTK